MDWLFLVLLFLGIAVPLFLLARAVTQDLETQREIDFQANQPSLAERKRESTAERRAEYRTQKQKERACFWTWPIGHVWKGPSYGRYCEFCGRKRWL